jgi:ABC-type sugar transport system ATPase subunit
MTKSFGGVRALRGVSFEVRAGEVHALLGENGAGKSTLIKILSGVHSFDSGTIEIEGAPVAFNSPTDSRRAGIAVVYQDLSLVESLSVGANLMLNREPTSRFGFLKKRQLMATAPTYKKVSQAGIKLVFMDSIPTGLEQVDFTDPAKVSQIAGDFLTANPDIKGVFAVWDQPALDTLSSMRAQNIGIPVTTVDLGLQSAIEIAKGGPLKATGSQRPYDQGAAEAMAMMNALIGKETPAWVGVQSLPVVQSNVLESFKTVFKKAPPAELTDACNATKPACN